MDTSRLKRFAPKCRVDLIDRIGAKLDYVLTAKTPDLAAQATLIKELERALEREGRASLLERVAYTWFNRFAAFRYLDARGWHPFRARLITAATPDTVLPELLQQVRTGVVPEELRGFIPLARINDLLDGRLPSPNPQAEVQRILVIGVSQYYAVLLPGVFDRIDAFTELLLPDDLLTEHSVVHGFVDAISDDDCAEVEVLGWLYQFYIAERKDTVMARKSAVPSEDIPAVTQLFTPHWIVRYLVENSLGRLWLLNRPGSRLRELMPYYIEGEAETDFLKITKPEEIKLLDPAVGSGHMLTYAFDLLYLIYEEEGHTPSEIPGLILRHNLFGLEICSRAAQLAELALVLKAREKSRQFFKPENFVRPDIIELREVRFAEGDLPTEWLGAGDQWPAGEVPAKADILHDLHLFIDAKNFGSLLQPKLSESQLGFLKQRVSDHWPLTADHLFSHKVREHVLRVLAQAESLTQQYHVVVANPPYMGSRGMNSALKSFAEAGFSNTRTDLFAMFITRSLEFLIPKGWSAMVTMQSWMFLPSYLDFRKNILATNKICCMAHLGPHAFDSIGGEIVQTTATVINKLASASSKGAYISLVEGKSEKEKNEKLLRKLHLEYMSGEEFLSLPASPIAYWMSPRTREIFRAGERLESIASPRQGLATGDNDTFLRYWHETAHQKIAFSAKSAEELFKSSQRWVPYSKGGPARKWYGNGEYVISFDKKSYDILAKSGNCLPSRHLYFKEALNWSLTSSSGFAARYRPSGYVFDVNGMSSFTEGGFTRLLGLVNSSIGWHLLRIINPTMAFQVGDIKAFPCINVDTTDCDTQVDGAIALARVDWDNFETSWDFLDEPLLRPGLKGPTLEASWRNWEAQSTAAIRQMQVLETENNRLFINAYGLEGELSPEVPENQITLARADARKDMAAFLSYALGCMMGRYSLDQPGLILADAGDTVEHYLAKVGKPLDQLIFTPDADGIIPVLDGEWFEDDIVARTRDFLSAAFGPETLEQNVAFIEESLGKDLRKYFTANTGGFYADHLQTYKKRPIYWMFESPKKHFRALIYLHRYDKDTVNRLLNGYLREFRHKLTHRIDELQNLADTGAATTPQVKELAKLKVALKDVEDYEREILLPLARQQLAIDLDDGVKTNYLKFGKALAPIAGLAKKEE